MRLGEEIRSKFREAEWSAGLSVGLVRGLSLGMSLLAVATAMFSGELSAYLLQGVGLFFFGTAILTLFLALFGKFPAPVATAPIPLVLVMILAAQTIPVQGQPLYITYAVVVIGFAMVSGVLFYAIGQFRVANVFRFVPFTVAAGTLAGSGILILLLALRTAGLLIEPASWPGLLEPMTFSKWASSLVLGISLLLLTQVWRKFWLMPVVFTAFCLLFHAALYVLDIPMDSAIAAGFFMEAGSEGALWPTITFQDFKLVHWNLVASQGLNAIVLFVVLMILTVVSFSQLELGASMEFDWNREFRRHGIANLLSGAGGGIPGATMASATLPNIALHANTTATSIVMALVLLLLVFFGEGVLRLVPIPASSGFLITLAVPLISDWLLKSRKRLDPLEYLMLVGICGTMVLVGILEAIAIGLVLSLIFFAVRLSQVRLVESDYSIQERRSRRTRSTPDQVVLKTIGSRARVYRLRGYLFFGVAFTLAGQLKQALQESEKPLASVIDFHAVTGFDLSALDSLKSYVQSASKIGVKTIVSAASRRLKQEIRRDFTPTLLASVAWAKDEDEALGKAEDILLEHHHMEMGPDPTARDELRREATPALIKHLDRMVVFEELVMELRDRVVLIEHADQQPISLAGQQPKGIHLLIRGKAWMQDGSGMRLSQLEAGAVIGASSAMASHESAASCIADGTCETLLITRQDLEALEREENQLALLLYRYILGAQS